MTRSEKFVIYVMAAVLGVLFGWALVSMLGWSL
jgi:hypothetical protein